MECRREKDQHPAVKGQAVKRGRVNRARLQIRHCDVRSAARQAGIGQACMVITGPGVLDPSPPLIACQAGHGVTEPRHVLEKKPKKTREKNQYGV